MAIIPKDQLRHIEAQSGKRCWLISGYEVFAGAIHMRMGLRNCAELGIFNWRESWNAS